MKSQTMLITPEMAKQFLLANVGNRPIGRNRVDAMKREIATGNWHLTHQGVAFSHGGALLDGQHRLTAIAEGDAAVMLVVWTDVPDSARLGMDIGRARSWVDQMGFDGTVKPSKREARCASAMQRGMASKQNATANENRSFFIRHHDAIKFATGVHNTAKVGIRVAQISAVVARASYHVKESVLASFCDELQTGNGANEMVFQFRDWLITDASHQQGTQASLTIYRKCARVVDAYRRGDTLKRIYEATSEPFPLPEEIEASKAPRLKVA